MMMAIAGNVENTGVNLFYATPVQVRAEIGQKLINRGDCKLQSVKAII